MEHRESLTRLVDAAQENIYKIYATADKPDFEMMATWVFEAQENIFVVHTPWASDQEKELMLLAVRSLCIARGVERYVLMTEGWAAEVDMNKNPELRNVQPRHRKDRMEVVQLSGADRYGNKMGRSFELTRYADRPPTVGTENRVTPETQIGGRMLEVLDGIPEKVPERMRRVAEMAWQRFAVPLNTTR